MREVDDSHNVARTDKLLRLSKSEGYSKKFSHFCACLEQPSARADETNFDEPKLKFTCFAGRRTQLHKKREHIDHTRLVWFEGSN